MRGPRGPREILGLIFFFAVVFFMVFQVLRFCNIIDPNPTGLGDKPVDIRKIR
jgi:hypothetical protein